MSNIYTYDLFISYAYEDKDSAQLLSRKLRKLDFLAWFDLSEINKEDLFDKKIREVIDNSAVCVLLIGASGQLPWINDSVWSAIHSRLERTHGTFRVIPVILPGAHTDSTGMLTALIRTQLISYLQHWTVIRFKESLNEEDVMHQLVLKIRGVEPDDQSDPLETKFRESVRLRAQNALNVNWSRLVFDLFSTSLDVFEDKDETRSHYEVNTAKDWQDAWSLKQECYDLTSRFSPIRSLLTLFNPDIYGERTPPAFTPSSYRMRQNLRRRFLLSYPVANNNITNLVIGPWNAKTVSRRGSFAESVEIFLEFLTGTAKLQREVDSSINAAKVRQVTRPRKWETLKHVVAFKKSKSLLIEEMERQHSIRLPHGTFMPDGGIDIMVAPATLADIPKQLCEHCALMQLGCFYNHHAVNWLLPDAEWVDWEELFHIAPDCEQYVYGLNEPNTILDFGESFGSVSPNKLLNPSACSASYFYGMVNRLYFEQKSAKKYVVSSRREEVNDVQSIQISGFSDLLWEGRKSQLQARIGSVVNSIPQDIQIIARLWAEGKSSKEIAREVGESVPTIYRTLKMFQRKLKTFIFSKDKDHPNPIVWHIDCPYCQTSAVDNVVMLDHFSPVHKGISYIGYKDGIQSWDLTLPDPCSSGFLLYAME